jgi:anti-anti-sigma factor
VAAALLSLQHGPGTARVVVRGELDLASADALRTTLADAGATARRVVLDLREVTFLDAAATGVLVTAAATGPATLSILAPVAGAAARFLELAGASAFLPL